jgi:allantoicase
MRICPGIIHGVDIDTSFFTGNYPPHASLDACHVAAAPDAHTEWQTLIGKTALAGDAHHYLTVADDRTWTHLRLNIYPDGGVARLRVYGVAHFNWNEVTKDAWTDLAAMQHGGRALACSDMHYGHMSNLIAPGRGLNMGDGWETRRRREPGNDWVILKLGHVGRIRQVTVDTAFFKGNYPARCSLHGALLNNLPDEEINASGSYWKPILPPVELGPDQQMVFEKEVMDPGPVSHVRLDIYPDGGVSRLRLLGEAS